MQLFEFKWRKSALTVLSTAVCLCFCTRADFAQEKSTVKNEPARQSDETPKKDSEKDSKGAKKNEKQGPLERWVELAKKKDKVLKRLDKLVIELSQTNPDNAVKRAKLGQEFEERLGEFQIDIYPEMVKLAPGIYQSNPQEYDAAEIVLGTTYGRNQYKRAAEIADKLLAAGQKNRIVFNVAGISHFALHNFEKAHNILLEAQQLEKLEDRLGGARYLQPSKDYVEFWRNEQAIRQKESAATGDEVLPHVSFETTRGRIVLELFENQAPNTVANFVNLVTKKFYDGTRFHRVKPGFIIQGGDPNTRDAHVSNDGYGGPGYTIDCECRREDARKHFRGTLSMAHSGRDTAGSQFFITQIPTEHLNPHQDKKREHTVFGRVIEGMDVVDLIKRYDIVIKATVVRKRNHLYKPKTRRIRQRILGPARSS